MSHSLSKLFHIREDHLRLVDQIEQADGELTPDVEASLMIKERELQETAVSYAYLILSFKAMAEQADKEIKRLQHLKSKAERLQELFKDQISGAMHQFKVDSIVTPTLRLSFRSARSVQIEDERLIPPEYFKQPSPVVSKELIKDAINAGTEVPGAAMVKKQHLQIS